jgi:hypothetical protein
MFIFLPCKLALCSVFLFYISKRKSEAWDESTLKWGQDCCHIILFFNGSTLELQQCDYYEGFSQCFCILW